MSAETNTIRAALALFRPDKGGHDLTAGETDIDAEHSPTCRRCAADTALAGIERDLADAHKATERLRQLARNARNAGAAPDYDELAIRSALWMLVDAVLPVASGRSE